MRLGKAIALVAVLGLVGLAATTMVQANGGSCGANSKASMQGCSGCPGHATMQKTGGSCSGQASAARTGGSCPAMGKGSCGSAKGASMQCSMAPADCEKMMRAYYKTHGWLGIEMDTADGLTPPTVTSIVTGSPAEKAGFKVGDVLTSINGISFDPKNAEALQGIMDKGFKVGQTVTYTAKRESQAVTLTPILASIPDANLNQMIATHLATAHKQQQQEKQEKSS